MLKLVRNIFLGSCILQYHHLAVSVLVKRGKYRAMRQIQAEKKASYSSGGIELPIWHSLRKTLDSVVTVFSVTQRTYEYNCSRHSHFKGSKATDPAFEPHICCRPRHQSHDLQVLFAASKLLSWFFLQTTEHLISVAVLRERLEDVSISRGRCRIKQVSMVGRHLTCLETAQHRFSTHS